MNMSKKIRIGVLLTILALPVYANYHGGVVLSLSPGIVYYQNYSNACNRLLWVEPQYYDDGTWVPGHYVTVNTCYSNNYNNYPTYFYYGYKGGHHGHEHRGEQHEFHEGDHHHR